MIAASPSVMISGPTSFRITPERRSFALAARTMDTSPPREVPRIVTFGSFRWSSRASTSAASCGTW
jgi:hypothetical protein